MGTRGTPQIAATRGRRRGERDPGVMPAGSAQQRGEGPQVMLLGWLSRGDLPQLHEDQGLPSGDRISALCLQLTPDLSPDVGGPADPIAPTIIIPPKNTSVVAGTSEVTMECVANAR